MYIFLSLMNSYSRPLHSLSLPSLIINNSRIIHDPWWVIQGVKVRSLGDSVTHRRRRKGSTPVPLEFGARLFPCFVPEVTSRGLKTRNDVWSPTPRRRPFPDYKVRNTRCISVKELRRQRCTPSVSTTPLLTRVDPRLFWHKCGFVHLT